MERRELLRMIPALPVVLGAREAAARQQEAAHTRGLPPLKITGGRVITTGGGAGYAWVFLKLLTSEPGLYGLGSASIVNDPHTVVTALERHLVPFWVGKETSRSEDLWQSTYVRSYWRNSAILNQCLAALDVALWDIKGKRAGMPVYELLGGKARDAVPTYAHADGRTPDEVVESVRRYYEEGYRHVRAQMGGVRWRRDGPARPGQPARARVRGPRLRRGGTTSTRSRSCSRSSAPGSAPGPSSCTTSTSTSARRPPWSSPSAWSRSTCSSSRTSCRPSRSSTSAGSGS